MDKRNTNLSPQDTKELVKKATKKAIDDQQKKEREKKKIESDVKKAQDLKNVKKREEEIDVVIEYKKVEHDKKIFHEQKKENENKTAEKEKQAELDKKKSHKAIFLSITRGIVRFEEKDIANINDSKTISNTIKTKISYSNLYRLMTVGRLSIQNRLLRKVDMKSIYIRPEEVENIKKKIDNEEKIEDLDTFSDEECICMVSEKSSIISSEYYSLLYVPDLSFPNLFDVDKHGSQIEERSLRNLEADHIVSSASQENNYSKKQGIAINISKEWHKNFTVTHGGSQKSTLLITKRFINKYESDFSDKEIAINLKKFSETWEVTKDIIQNNKGHYKTITRLLKKLVHPNMKYTKKRKSEDQQKISKILNSILEKQIKESKFDPDTDIFESNTIDCDIMFRDIGIYRNIVYTVESIEQEVKSKKILYKDWNDPNLIDVYASYCYAYSLLLKQGLFNHKFAPVKVIFTEKKKTNKDDAKIEDSQLEDSKIEDSQREDPQIEDSLIKDSKIEDSQREDPQIEDPQIEDSTIKDSKIEDSQIEDKCNLVVIYDFVEGESGEKSLGEMLDNYFLKKIQDLSNI